MSEAFRGVAILALAYMLGVATFYWGGFPPIASVFLGGSYALSALSALMLSRGLLDMFLGLDRPGVFFIVLRRVSDPLLAMLAPVTPGFLVPFAQALYAAFLFYFLKTFLFGDAVLGLPPLFIVLWLVLAA
jgi:hypothetical protein